MNGDKASIDGIIAFLKAGPLDPNTGDSFRNIIYNFMRLGIAKMSTKIQNYSNPMNDNFYL